MISSILLLKSTVPCRQSVSWGIHGDGGGHTSRCRSIIYIIIKKKVYNYIVRCFLHTYLTLFYIKHHKTLDCFPLFFSISCIGMWQFEVSPDRGALGALWNLGRGPQRRHRLQPLVSQQRQKNANRLMVRWFGWTMVNCSPIFFICSWWFYARFYKIRKSAKSFFFFSMCSRKHFVY